MKSLNLSNWSILGYVASLVFGGITLVNFYFLHPDVDKCIAYLTTAGLIFAVSWLYNKQLHQQNTIDAVEDYLDDRRDILN